MSLVHTNKTLKRLAASNAMRWKDRVFEMLDRAALERIAGDDGGQHGRGRLSDAPACRRSRRQAAIGRRAMATAATASRT